MRKLTDWLDSYMEYVNETEPSPLYHRWVAVSTIASVMQRKCWVNNGGIIIYPNFYIVLVGPSSARKGTAMLLANNLVKQCDITINRAPKTTTREMMIKILDLAQTASPDGDDKMIVHNSLNITSTELTVFLGQKNFQFIQDLTDWWDCLDDWDYLTKGSGTYTMHNIWVNLLGATTPELLWSSLPIEAIVGGLTQRMILVYAPRRFKIVPVPLLDAGLEESLCRDLEDIAGITGEYKTTFEYVDAYSSWYLSQNADNPLDDPRFNGYRGRRQMFVWKLSLICCASRTNERVLRLCDLEKAINMLTEVEGPMHQALGGVGSSPLSGTLSKVMTVLSFKRDMTKGELMGIFHNDVTLEELNAILAMLEVEGKVVMINTDRVQYRG